MRKQWQTTPTATKQEMSKKSLFKYSLRYLQEFVESKSGRAFIYISKPQGGKYL
jgi:hypothetical protein